MNQKNLPPKSLLQQIRDTTSINRLFTDAREPHLIFLPQDTSRRMLQEMLKVNMRFEDFVEQACVQFINKIDNETMAEEEYLDYNDVLQMQSIQTKKEDHK